MEDVDDDDDDDDDDDHGGGDNEKLPSVTGTKTMTLKTTKQIKVTRMQYMMKMPAMKAAITWATLPEPAQQQQKQREVVVVVMVVVVGATAAAAAVVVALMTEVATAAIATDANRRKRSRY